MFGFCFVFEVFCFVFLCCGFFFVWVCFMVVIFFFIGCVSLVEPTVPKQVVVTNKRKWFGKRQDLGKKSPWVTGGEKKWEGWVSSKISTATKGTARGDLLGSKVAKALNKVA